MMTAFSKWLAVNVIVVASLCLCAGIVVARVLGVHDDAPSLLVPVPALLAAAVLPKRGGGYIVVALCLLFLALGFRLATMEIVRTDSFSPPVTPQIVHAAVSKTLGSGPGFRILLVESGAGDAGRTPLPGYGRVFLRDNNLPLCAGDRVAFRSRVRKPTGRGNPGEYNWEIHCKSERIGWQASVRGEQSVLLIRRGSRWAPGAVLFRVRRAMGIFLELHAGRIFDESSRREVRAILKGIVLGDRGEIDHSLSKSFAHSGLAHMLSASGLHVGIVVMLAFVSVKGISYTVPRMLLRVPFPRAVALVSIPAMILYCLLVGSRVPAMRATIMGVVFAAAILLDRRWSSFNSLALAAILILIVQPLSLFTPGFQLSFVAVAGILMVADAMTKRFRSGVPVEGEDEGRGGQQASGNLRGKMFLTLSRWAFGLTLTSVAATVAVAPLLLETFHAFPVYTLAANLSAGFFLTVGLCFGLTAAAVGAAWPWLGSLILIPADITVRLIIGIAKFFQGLPWSTVHVSHMTFAELGLVSTVAFALLMLVRKPSRRAAAILCASLAGLIVASGASHLHRSSAKDLTMVFLNVGNGDSIFVRPPGSKGLLVDGGIRTPYFDTGVSVVIPFLNRTGARALDGLLVTHPQMDHMGGLLSVLDEIPAKQLWWNPVGVSNNHWDRIVVSARAKGVPLRSANRRGPTVKMGEATLRFLNEPAPSAEAGAISQDLNDRSVVFRLDYGAVSALFTGDLERKGEEELLQCGVPLQATILKVGHHGGRTSSTWSFLQAVRPQIAIISAEYPAWGGRPRQEVIDRLKSVGAEVYWTGRDGAITVSTDGRSSVRVTAGKSGAPRVFPLNPHQEH